MRVKISLIIQMLVFLLTFHAEAQAPNYSLQTNESGSSKSYVARDYVTLKPGFKYSASSGQSFNAKIDVGLLFPPTTQTYKKPDGTFTSDPTQGTVVGSIPGQFAVSPTGAATYTIPIEVPAGINGMQPIVSIVYNSQLPVGLLGRGFDLACSSTITRVPHSFYYDNDSHSVSFDGNDKFALDGMRLICDDIEKYGDDKTVYFTENNQTSRITSIGNIGDGPEYFIVETADGKTMEYGNTNDSRIIPLNEAGVYIWYLKKVTDNNGNSIKYIYTKINSETVLSSIQYSGGTVEFLYSYTASITKNNYFINGNEVKNILFLERIRVKGLNDYIRNYEFNGLTKDGQVLITEIKEYYNKNGRNISEIDFEEESCSYKESIKINWSNTVSSSFNNSLLPGLSLATSPVFIDFNNDGYDDVFFVTKTGEVGSEVYTQKIVQNTGSGKNEIFNKVIYDAGDIPEQGETIESSEIKVLNRTINSFVDINGDGKADLLYKTKSIMATPQGIIYKYNLRIRGLIDEISYVPIYEKIYNDAYDYRFGNTQFRSKEYKVIYGDFDGDAVSEILAIQDNNICWLIKYVNGALIKTSIATNGVNLYDVDEIPIGDFDGDSKMDFGVNINSKFKTYKIVNNAFVEIYTFHTGVKYVADVNQDGVTDLILFGAYSSNFTPSNIYDPILQNTISTLVYSVYFRQKDNSFLSIGGELLKGNVFSDFIRKNFPSFSAESSQLTTSETFSVKDVRFEDIDGDGLLNIVLLYDRKFDFQKTVVLHRDYDSPSDDFTSESQAVISSFMDNEEFFVMNEDRSFVYPSRNKTHYSYWINTTGNIAIGTYCGNRFIMKPKEYKSTLNLGDVDSRYDFSNLFIANINGNGNKSIYAGGTWENYLGSKVFNFVQKTNDTESSRYSVSSIEDTYGNKISVNYKIPEQAGTAQAFPYFTYKTGSPVASTVTESNTSLNFSRTSTYSFTNEVFHRYKGFLGYLNTSVTNPDGIVQSTTGVLNTDFGLIVPKWENSIMKNVTTDFTIVDKLNKRYWIRPDKITEVSFLNTGTQNSLKTTKTFDTYDTNGNPTSIKTEYGDNTGVSSTETVTYIQKGSWYANKPETYTILKKGLNVPNETRTKEYTYYGNGNLKSEITDKDDDRQLTKEYVYDSFGNPTHISISARDLTKNEVITRTTVMTYTPTTGRFLETKTDPLGHITTYHWNTEDGTLTSEDSQSDINDSKKKTTTYKYDIWGNLIETVYPDGMRKTQAMQWAEPNNALKAKYYVYSQTSGTAPVQVWYDALGREVSKETYGLNGRKVYMFTEYNPDGRVKRVSEPTFNTSAEAWAQYDFVYNSDPFKRVTSVKTPTGTVTNTYGKTSTVTFTAVTPDGIKNTSQETTLNDAGQKISSRVNGKEVTFTYYASGLPKTSTPAGGQALTMVYDLQGNRTFLNDPDAGIVESTYNGFGELVEEKQKVHDNSNYITTANTYKPNGLLDNINRNGETTTYTYDAKNRVSKIEISTTNKQEFTYDDFDRIVNVKETIGERAFERKTEYDFYGRVKKDIYPTGYYTTNKYDEYSNLTEVIDKENRSIWKVIDENARGQITHISKGGKITSYGFDPITGFPTSTFASGVINYSYVFNNLGNLIERNDNNGTQKEKFIYDSQDRLTDWNIYHNITTLVKHNSITYDATSSNITAKSDLGAFTLGYGGNRPNGSAIGPHALTSISGVPASFPQPTDAYQLANLDVTYTDFKKIKTLSEMGKTYELTYGVDDQRRKSVYAENGVTKLTRYYAGDYEEEVDALGNLKQILYLSGAIMIRANGVETLYYSYADYQGSLIALTDESGNVVERYAYDPWGARRNPDNWTEKDNRTTWIVNRGYTGHEHLDAFGIINMNGRVYDPLTAMFFSPDPYVQAPDNWLNYNRYGYAFGNPFKYTDPSGEFIWFIYAGAALVGGTLNLISNWKKVDNLWSALGYFGSGAVGAAVSVLNPVLGGSITSGGNLITDIVGGKVPDFKDSGDVLMYAGGLAFDGWGAAGIGQLGKYIGVKFASSYLTTTAVTGTFAKVGGATATEAFQVAGVEFSVVSTKVGSAPAQMALQAAKGGAEVAGKTGGQYTKSSIQLGQKIHDVYKAGDVVDEIAMKEFNRIKGIRPDFVDFSTKTIYELKPFNPRSIQRGWKQLYNYQKIFQEVYGGEWNIVLDLYHFM